MLQAFFSPTFSSIALINPLNFKQRFPHMLLSVQSHSAYGQPYFAWLLGMFPEGYCEFPGECCPWVDQASLVWDWNKFGLLGTPREKKSGGVKSGCMHNMKMSTKITLNPSHTFWLVPPLYDFCPLIYCQPWHLLCLMMVTKTNFRPSGMRKSWLDFV